MKLPNTPNILEKVRAKRKPLIIIVLAVAVVGAGFAVSGVAWHMFHDSRTEGLSGKVAFTRAPNSLSKPDIGPGASLQGTSPAPDGVPAPAESAPSAPKTTVSAPQPTPSPTPQPQTVSAPVSAPTAQPGYMNPFVYNYNRAHADKIRDLLERRTVAQLEAEIREAENRGKKEAASSRTAAPLPHFEALPRIEKAKPPVLPEELKPQAPPQPAPPRVVKFKIPGYTGVVIDTKRRAVILDDGNLYEVGTQVADGVVLYKIDGAREIYVKDAFGNVHRMRPVAHDIQVTVPSART